MGRKWKQWQVLFSCTPKSLRTVTAGTNLKDLCSLEESYDKPRQHIKKQRHHFADKGLSALNYGFSSSHVWMWELDQKEGWILKNWCFWIMVLEKTPESPWDSKETKPVHPKGNLPWIFTGRTDAEALILWPLDAKSLLIWKSPWWRLEKEMAIHSSFRAWRIPLTEEPGRLQSMGSHELDMT